MKLNLNASLFFLAIASAPGAVPALANPSSDTQPIVLGPQSPLAVALDALLPTVPSFQNPLASWQIVKQAAVTSPGSTEAHLITCTTSSFVGRAPEPVLHFQGCKVTLTEELPDAVATLSLTGLFEKAAAVEGAPSGGGNPPSIPSCPRCAG